MSYSSGVELWGSRGLSPLCYFFNIMGKQGNEKIFHKRDSGRIFIVQATISLLFVGTQFTIKITTLKTRVTGAIVGVAHFHLAPLPEPI